jgi:hypothetical protein
VKLSRGERWAIPFYALVVLGFMPPVIGWANRAEPFVLGIPFLLFWVGFMTVMTTVLMSLALWVQRRVDRE